MHVHLLLRWLDQWRPLVQGGSCFCWVNYGPSSGRESTEDSRVWQVEPKQSGGLQLLQQGAGQPARAELATSQPLGCQQQGPTHKHPGGQELSCLQVFSSSFHLSYPECFLKSQTLIFFLNLSVIWKATMAEVCRHSNTEPLCCPTN